MTTTRNKMTIDETLYMEDEIIIIGIKQSEYITITQNKEIIIPIRIDEISSLISSLQRFLENGEIVEI